VKLSERIKTATREWHSINHAIDATISQSKPVSDEQIAKHQAAQRELEAAYEAVDALEPVGNPPTLETRKVEALESIAHALYDGLQFWMRQ
jgi:hypothetical protein